MTRGMIAMGEQRERRARPDLRIALALLLFLLGSISNLVIYESVQPLMVAGIMFGSAMLLLRFSGLSDREERQAFLLVYAIGWMWMGISAAYAVFFDDFFQNYRDPALFFNEIALGNVPPITDWGLLSIVENAGALALWGMIYDFCVWLGFDKAPYIGIAFNNLLISGTVVVGIKVVKMVYGNDRVRIRRFVLLYSWCGLFWMFASTHLRDAATLFAISLLILSWVVYLARPGLLRFTLVVTSTILGFLTLGLLRVEFAFVPFALIWAAILAFIFSGTGGVARRRIFIASLILAIPVGVYLYLTLHDGILNALVTGQETYNALSEAEQTGESSLGNSLVVNQPVPIRLVLGSVYLLMYPIPFWVGFQLQSVYHLLKSIQVLYMYMLAPLLGLAVWRLFGDRKWRTPAVMFLFFVSIIFIIGISYTSLENRHLGSFFIALLCLAMIPDLSRDPDKSTYRKWRITFLGMVTLVHLAWAVLKWG